MESKIVLITPELAAKILSKNTSNRKISISTIKKYVESIKSGDWRLNGVPIIVAKDGRLVDGQHRLTAIIQANTSIESIVVTGVDFDVFSTVDRGKVRSNSDLLSINGNKNSYKLATAIRSYHKIACGNHNINPSEQELIGYADNEAINHYVFKYVGHKNRYVIPASFIGVCAALHDIQGIDIATDFFEKVMSGANLSETSPEYILRERFINIRKGTQLHWSILLAISIKAANAKILNQNIKLLRYNVEIDKFPRLIGQEVLFSKFNEMKLKF